MTHDGLLEWQKCNAVHCHGAYTTEAADISNPLKVAYLVSRLIVALLLIVAVFLIVAIVRIIILVVTYIFLSTCSLLTVPKLFLPLYNCIQQINSVILLLLFPFVPDGLPINTSATRLRLMTWKSTITSSDQVARCQGQVGPLLATLHIVMRPAEGNEIVNYPTSS